ncbi:hypothetical protein BGZ82_004049, partial [Podila clonocystis]
MFPKTFVLISVLALAVYAVTLPEVAQGREADTVKPASCPTNCECSRAFSGFECSKNNHVYQCSPQGQCCDWGYRDSCR